ncbi:MAG: NusG domain II-containing protein [Oscillospiraceae bacterium]|nr:NusG domain II-containing protein [Oscillospiraceae bacterium]
MKTKYWVVLLAALLLICTVLSVVFLRPGQAQQAEIWSDGKLIKTVLLRIDQEFTVESADGVNTVTVQDGKIAVTAASCPDGYCMQRGFCQGGAQIVCLPNRLVIKFVAQQEIDGVVG